MTIFDIAAKSYLRRGMSSIICLFCTWRWEDVILWVHNKVFWMPVLCPVVRWTPFYVQLGHVSTVRKFHMVPKFRSDKNVLRRGLVVWVESSFWWNKYPLIRNELMYNHYCKVKMYIVFNRHELRQVRYNQIIYDIYSANN